MIPWTVSETLSRIEGFYVGLLDQEELAIFDDACEHGWATRSYEGAGGFMWLAKVRIVAKPETCF